MKTTIKDLLNRYTQLNVEAEEHIRDILRTQPDCRASFVVDPEDDPASLDSYPVTVTIRDDSQDATLGITDVYLDEKGGICYKGLDVDYDTEIEDIPIDPSVIPDILSFFSAIIPE